jgi:hypothetical protein
MQNMIGSHWHGFFILLVAGAGLHSPATAQNLPKCGETKVQYSPFDAAYANKIVLESTTDSKVPTQASEKQYSPQQTMWQTKIESDYMKEGPWSTTVYIGSGSPAVLKLSFIDHDNSSAQVQWLNEKLVFGRVWWGRVYSTDFILDVQKREFIYKEMAHYGELIQPCL